LGTRAQLTDLGLGPSAIEHALKRGRLHRIHQGVDSMVPSPALAPLAAELAAVLACGDSALLSHQSAAAAWSLRALDEARCGGPGMLEAILVRIATALASRAA
jgi:hypothetical protein